MEENVKGIKQILKKKSETKQSFHNQNKLKKIKQNVPVTEARKQLTKKKKKTESKTKQNKLFEKQKLNNKKQIVISYIEKMINKNRNKIVKK